MGKKPPDFVEGSLALNGVLKVSLGRGVTAGHNNEDFSGDGEGHYGTLIIRRITESSKPQEMAVPELLRQYWKESRAVLSG